jgi:hypothetical protein
MVGTNSVGTVMGKNSLLVRLIFRPLLKGYLTTILSLKTLLNILLITVLSQNIAKGSLFFFINLTFYTNDKTTKGSK